jgi:glycosyltransferase involved in cell wall biosynthesis
MIEASHALETRARADLPPPLVSVVIPTYKRPDLLINAVKSALAQGDIVGEVTVVDDNDDPKYIKATRDAIDGMASTKVNLLKNSRTKGGCGSRNTGIVNSRFEFISFLDDDDYFVAGALKAHLAAFTGSDVGMVYGAAKIVDEVYDNVSIILPRTKELTVEQMIKGSCPSSSSIVVAKRQVLVEAGLFDETLPSFQDYDMWLKILKVSRALSHNTVVAEFVQHSEDRVSVNLKRRFAGLDIICEKWKKEINEFSSPSIFKRRYVSAAHNVNGQLMLSRGLKSRSSAIYHFSQTVINAPKYKLNYAGWLILAVFGFQATKFAMKTKHWLKPAK